MKTSDDLRRAIRSLDHRGYPSLKSLAGAYAFKSFTLVIDHVQGDPFASPSSLHVEVPHKTAGFPARYRGNACARRALADYLTRCFARELTRVSMRVRGSGKSGLLATSRCGQEVLERSACEVGEACITVRFSAGLPAFGRSVNAEGLEGMLLGFVPRCVENALIFAHLDARDVEAAVWLAEDQAALREIMRKEGLVSFVANGSVLPRESGVSERPLEGGLPFVSPRSLERTFTLPHSGSITGMAVPQGITLVVGGGYHGKSTLLEAVQSGVYDHIVGDGREFVLTDATALKLRAEDGRSVRDVDISAFIGNLPNGKDTRAFSTECASGSTSQAASLVEGVEAGTRLLLIDEDTSATNFMVRDELMSRVIAPDKEPITPFVMRARELYEACGVSTMLVAGSSGAFFDIADRVIQMDCYRPIDITERVRRVCAEARTGASVGSLLPEPATVYGWASRAHARAMPLIVASEYGRDAQHGRGRGRGGRGGDGGARGGRDDRSQARGREGRMKVKAFGCDTVSLGKSDVDVRYLEQLADGEQTLALAYFARFVVEKCARGDAGESAERTAGSGILLREAVDEAYEAYERRGWKPFCGSYVPCGLALPRKLELFACLNRLRG